MASWKAWARGLDLPIYVVGLMPPLIGAAATLSSPSPLPLALAATATGAFLALHVAVNLYNDAFDAATPADRLKRHSLARLAPLPALLGFATGLLILSCIAGIALWLRVGGWAVPLMSALGLVLVFAYHAPPLRLSHRGWGEAVTFLGFGVIPVWTVAALADGHVPRSAWLPGVATGLAAAWVLFHHNLTSRASDAAAAKRTLATRMRPAVAHGTLHVGTFFLGLGVVALSPTPLGLAWVGLIAFTAVWTSRSMAPHRTDSRWASLSLFVTSTTGFLVLLLVD